MADNTQLNVMTGGDIIKTEDVGGYKLAVTKLYLGAHGIDGGPVTANSPLPVAIGNFPAVQAVSGTITATSATPFVVSGSVNVGNFPSTQAITGSVSVGNFPANQAVTVGNFPASQTISGAVSVSNFPSTQTVAGTITVGNFPTSQAVTVGNFPSTQPVSGNVGVTNFPANQSISGTVSVANFPSSQTISGTVNVGNFPNTQTITGSVGVSNFPANQAVTVGNFPSTQTISGTVSVGNFPSTQPITGTVGVSNFPANQSVTVGNLPATQAVSGTVNIANFPTTQTVSLSGTATTTANLAVAGQAVGAANPVPVVAVTALPAGTNTLGAVISQPATGIIYSGTVALTPLFAAISASASGDNTIVAATAGKKVRVLKYTILSGGTVAAKFRSPSSGDLTGAMPLAANCGVGGAFCPVGLLETVAGDALVLNLSAAVSVAGHLTYILV